MPGLNPIFMTQKSGEFNGEIGIISVFLRVLMNALFLDMFYLESSLVTSSEASLSSN